MPQAITLQQLFQTPVITRVVSRFKTPMSLFQQFLNVLPGQTATESVSGRHVGWDIFDKTRSIAKGRAPGSGPATAQPKAVGHVSAVAYRTHEKIPLLREQIFRTRTPGAQFGQVDSRGQGYIARQMQYLTQRFRNNREFMVSRLFRGGYGLALDGEDFIPTELGAAGNVMDVSMQLPDTHKNQLALGTGSDIITANWHTSTTDVMGNVYSINEAFERLHGYPLRHIWCGTALFKSLLVNDGLESVGGTAFRVFESLSARQQRSAEGIQDSGFDVVFRALPLVTFHVYDGVLTTPELSIGGDETTTANTSKLIPDNKIICTPEPDGNWGGWIEGSEWIAENYTDFGREVFGFHTWTTPSIDPAAIELKMIDNGLPALYIPSAIAYGDITG